MYNSTTIANYFVTQFPDGKLTPMKLLKLVYIAQGWYMALTNGEKKLVNEKIEAWDYGPVFPSLYQSLKSYGKTIITVPIPSTQPERVNDNDAEFLNTIWDKYGKYSGIVLSAMTHQPGTPWMETYRKGTNEIIPDEKILSHYTNMIAQ